MKFFKLGKEYYIDSQYADVNRELKMIVSEVLNLGESYITMHDDIEVNSDNKKKRFLRF